MMIGSKEDCVDNDTHNDKYLKHLGIDNDLQKGLHILEPDRTVPRAKALVEIFLEFVQLLHELFIGT